ncbi:MAG: S9 family peptidase [Dysgonamonadaceae bacterium]|jgi:dipeptidyl-peptidase-4|nr:S9 family peptidase [Dysgonamonadaceae bacterium]
MKNYFSLFIFMFCAMNTFAQEKQLTLEDLIPGGKTHHRFSPKTDYSFRWKGDDLIQYNLDSMWIAEVRNPGKKKLFLTKEELRTLVDNEKANLDQISFTLIDGKYYGRIAASSKLIFINPEMNDISFAFQTEKNDRNISFCPENKTTAFTVDNNLYLRSTTGEVINISRDEKPNIVYGQIVHRNEFGINSGIFWSPKGNFLAFYRMDESMVTDYPLVDISAREAKLKNIKYPMAGNAGHEVTLGIYSMQSGNTVYMKTGEPKDHYLTNVSWDPTEKYIYIAELNREQNHMQLNKYSVETGEKTATLFEEKSDKYVEPQNPLFFLPGNPEQFVWQSRRTGYNHLYLYNTLGTLIKQLSSGNWEVNKVLGFDAESKNVYITSNELNPIEFQSFQINLQSGKKTQLSKAPGVHSPQLSASGKYMTDYYSNRETPKNVDLIDISKGKISRLQTAVNPYSDYTLPEISLGSIKAADKETDIYYRLIKPTHFDSTKKYPTIIYVYGGPHSQMVLNNWPGSVRGWEIYMAQKGYVLFSLDNRGTSNRGLEFESITHRQLGLEETADQMEGVKFLESLPYVDADRIGVHGWSYGGFMTTNLMLRHPDKLKVGVAGGPVIDWKYYEIMYGERYMDSPEENPEGYEKTNMNNLAGNLKGRLLLIHGDEDPIVVWQHSLSFLKTCIKVGTYPDYFVYPGQEHNMVGRDRVHLHEKIARYFDDYLK